MLKIISLCYLYDNNDKWYVFDHRSSVQPTQMVMMNIQMKICCCNSDDEYSNENEYRMVW